MSRRGSDTRSQSSSRFGSAHYGRSNVQEELFGNRRKAASTKNAKQEIATDAVVLRASDIMRLKKAASAQSAAEIEEQQRAEREARLAREQAAQARKERMLAIEAERLKQQPVSDLEAEATVKANSVIERAQRARDEDHDDAKHMNSMILYAKCATIREAQIEEKRQISEEEKLAERAAAEMMEVERQKAIKLTEERLQQLQVERVKGAAVLRQQIESRERDRMRELELKDQESQALLKQIEIMKLEDAKAVEARREAARRLMEEVAAANAEQIIRKQKVVEAEREEERRIQDYVAEKERREAEFHAEQERIRIAKEREVARLRALQEKASDKQSERDALRAKRAQEAYEREWREKELAAARKREKINADLAAAREQQQAEKERRLAELARAEKAEFDRIIQVQKSIEQTEKEKAHAEEMRRRVHAEDVRGQIAEKENSERLRRQAFFEEGRRLRQEAEAEKKRLEGIKQRKIEEMKAAGVPSKYLVQLERKQMTVK